MAVCLLLAAVVANAELSAESSCGWAEWRQFKQHYVSQDGRVIDPANGKNITTSEGQSYGLFFALVANDRPTFDLLLSWTENNLAQGDLSQHLPAWLWGAEDDRSNNSNSRRWTVLDTNSASDADLWIAYALIEASRLWQEPRYQNLAEALLKRISEEETVTLPGFGKMLLPGKIGFVHDGFWRINPSYLPLQILERLAAVDPLWQELAKNSQKMLIETAAKGFSPDWVIWQQDRGWMTDSDTEGRGSYDSIRVYLWLGMLADQQPQKKKLLNHFRPMQLWTNSHGVPPEKMDTVSGKSFGQRQASENDGPPGFSAALLPFLANNPPTLAQQRLRVKEFTISSDNYYNSVLILFGKGWDDKQYRFNLKGEVIPTWSGQCKNIG